MSSRQWHHGTLGLVLLAAASAATGCAQDGDLLQYRILQSQPTSQGLGVLIEVLASPAGSEVRGFSIELEMGTYQVDGQPQTGPFCRELGNSKMTEPNLEGTDIVRMLLAVVPTDQEALLTLSIGDKSCEHRIDTIQIPVKKPTSNEGSGSGSSALEGH